jgi:hypothetical protein
MGTFEPCRFIEEFQEDEVSALSSFPTVMGLITSRTLHLPMALLITTENNEFISDLEDILPSNLTSFTSDWQDVKMPNAAIHYKTHRMVNRYYAKRSWPILCHLMY